MYYVAIRIEQGLWTETFGDHDRDCVDFEVRDWKDHGATAKEIKRKAFTRVPTQAALGEWALSFAKVR